MKTILDIQKPGFPSVKKIYKVESPTELFEAIEGALNIDPLIEKIKVQPSDRIHVSEWASKYGFDFSNYFKGEIKFRGFTRWVYFKDKEPVFFDSYCSGTDTKPHTASFRSSIYLTLEFDECKKIRF